ncbi:hypothetical protein V5F49_17230 [Xanthobacter sp. V3C-3]|uniref:hypothetical protein n=1 Tax=Xanthobacter lutulentifluminis TaxID=3119935 RepID=UPI00372B1A89
MRVTALGALIGALAVSGCASEEAIRRRDEPFERATVRGEALLTPAITDACRDRLLERIKDMEQSTAFAPSVLAARIVMLKRYSDIMTGERKVPADELLVIVAQFRGPSLGLKQKGMFGCSYRIEGNKLVLLDVLLSGDFYIQRGYI